MSGRKGVGHYSEELKEQIIQENKSGASVKGLSKQYGISRYAIQSWCGLRPEVELRHSAPLPKGRHSKHGMSTDQELKRLRMENELLRDFLRGIGRK
jgi:transposase